MPILNLKYVGNDTIGSLRLNEILSGFLKTNIVFRAKVRYEEFVQTLLISFSY